MTKVEFSFRTWAAVVCVVVSGLWQGNVSVADIIMFGGGNVFNMEFVTISGECHSSELSRRGRVFVQYGLWGGVDQFLTDRIDRHSNTKSRVMPSVVGSIGIAAS